jgi:hypothetical protein
MGGHANACVRLGHAGSARERAEALPGARMPRWRSMIFSENRGTLFGIMLGYFFSGFFGPSTAGSDLM